ncbi:hypothetical protein LCGC14_1648990 [marine sediment metagenome]|uniref:Uncharacterized protein n=1 Tax=marine sediment metagenome TaxID=412755 RepID=A0A0F9IJZ0_9ZZZZ
MIKPTEKPTVTLVGMDGDMLGTLRCVEKALSLAGADSEYLLKYQNEIIKDDLYKDYNRLLDVTRKYVNVRRLSREKDEEEREKARQQRRGERAGEDYKESGFES